MIPVGEGHYYTTPLEIFHAHDGQPALRRAGGLMSRNDTSVDLALSRAPQKRFAQG
jgi:hypothetical protein